MENTTSTFLRFMVVTVAIATVVIIYHWKQPLSIPLPASSSPPSANPRQPQQQRTDQNPNQDEHLWALSEKLLARGKEYKLEHLEVELTLKFWELRAWLKQRGVLANDTICPVVDQQPPEFFDFTRNKYNLWTEPGDRILAQQVWSMQQLIQSIAVTNESEPGVPAEKTMFVGDLAVWDRGNFKPEWLTAGRISGCHSEWLNLGQCDRRFEPTCRITTEYVDYLQGHVDAVVSYASSSPFKVGQKKRTSRAKEVPWFKYVLESPYILPVAEETDDHAQYINSYHGGSMVTHKPFRWVYYDPRVRALKQQNKDYSAGKKKLAAIFVSNCKATNDRLAYVTELQKHIQVDVYGKCGTMSCQRDTPCELALQRDYFFYLSFENANCADYVTEKFYVNALTHGIVPVVMGAPPTYYARYAPQNSYVHVDEFGAGGPAELAKYLKFVAGNASVYNAYFEWVGTGEVVYNYYWLCNICQMLYYVDNERMPLPKGTNALGSSGPKSASGEWLPDTLLDSIGTRMCLPKGKWYWNKA